MDKWNEIIVSHCMKQIGEYFYTPAINYNALYRFRQDGTNVTYLGSFQNEDFFRRHIYGAAAEQNGVLYLPPMNGLHIGVYDIKRELFSEILLEKKYGSSDMYSKFFGALSWNEYVFFIPCRYRALVRLNTRTGELKYIDSFIQNYWPEIPVTEMLIKNGYFIKENKLYLASYSKNQVVCMNLLTNETELWNIQLRDDAKQGFIGMFMEEDNLYLLRSHAAQIVRYSVLTKDVKVYEIGTEPLKSEQLKAGIPFINLVKIGEDKILAAAYENPDSVILSLEDGSIEYLKEEKKQENDDFKLCWDAENYFIEDLDENRCIKCNIHSGTYTIIHKSDLEMISFVARDEGMLKRKLFLKNTAIVIEGVIELEDFINYVQFR